MNKVEIGQIYEDLDRRAPGRRFRVVSIDLIRGADSALVENVISPKIQRHIKIRRLLNKNKYRRVEVAEPRQARDEDRGARTE